MKRVLSLVVLALMIAVAGGQPCLAGDCERCVMGTLGIWFCDPGEPTGWYDCWYQGGQCFTGGGSCPILGGGCFLSGTLVDTEFGYMAIEELGEGDHVVGLTGSDELVPCEVTRTYRVLQPGYYVINGEIRATATHPFMVSGEWVEASEIQVGDELMGKDLNPISVESIVFVDKVVRAYNIEVSDAHTFFAQGVLVHNKSDPFR
ncbi:MAG: hypothetical protein JSW58_13450 [Candidatus Latescibacterota bacterium]|nr:MAG: hypothetical protein JSW58_13450 [Candidatus Latescibacterota bacterium]